LGFGVWALGCGGCFSSLYVVKGSGLYITFYVLKF